MTFFNPDSGDLRAPPVVEKFVTLSPSFGTRFMVTVDTEEEFDWNAPFDRESHSVSIVGAMRTGQDYFAAAGVRPLYFADYPVIDDAEGGTLLAEWAAEGTADVGVHCHPWVTPPHEEDVSVENSFAGNLPEALERAKLTALRDRFVEVIGRTPIAFRAGRYGVGANTGRILRDLGFYVDSSIRPRFDYRAEHGPDFSGLPVRPYRTGPDGAILELPLSTAFTGALGRWGEGLLPLVGRGGAAAGALARFQLLRRVPLTPEGVGVRDALRGVDRLIADGARLLMFSFHSPSLAPGFTPYVRDEAGLRSFYRWWDEVLDHLAQRGVKPAGLEDVIAACSG